MTRCLSLCTPARDLDASVLRESPERRKSPEIERVSSTALSSSRLEKKRELDRQSARESESMTISSLVFDQRAVCGVLEVGRTKKGFIFYLKWMQILLKGA